MRCKICRKTITVGTAIKNQNKFIIVCDDCLTTKNIETPKSYTSKDWLKILKLRKQIAKNASKTFWLHLCKYNKRPNRKSLDIIFESYMWAFYKHHNLYKSFSKALNYLNINVYAERGRTDLPKE